MPASRLPFASYLTTNRCTLAQPVPVSSRPERPGSSFAPLCGVSGSAAQWRDKGTIASVPFPIFDFHFLFSPPPPISPPTPVTSRSFFSPLATLFHPALYFPFTKMPIQTIIVDDEKPAREELAYLLKSFPEISLVGQGKNGLEAVNLIKEHAPDLVFLDVQMPGLDGFGVLQKLVERKLKVPHVVFATAFDHYAVQAFDVNAVDYVLKPFDKARISKAIQKAKKEIEAQTSPAERLEQLVNQLGAGGAKGRASAQVPKLLVKSQQKLLLVDSDDLIFAMIEEGAVSVSTLEVEGTSNYRTLEELQAALDTESYWRPHRSYLVSIRHIKEVVPWFNSTYMLKMDDKKQTEIPVSRQQAKRLRELFKL